MRTSRSGTPTPVRTCPIRVASLMSAAALAAATGSAAGSPTVLMTRKPEVCARFIRKNPLMAGFFT